jgi:guanine deaminase
VIERIVRGPLLIPRDGGVVDYHAEGALAIDERGALAFAGAWAGLRDQLGDRDWPPVRASDGVMMPPLLDIHTHVSQHPIRGRFVEGVGDDEPGGKLLNGLKRNVFPAEARCADEAVATRVAEAFLRDTLAHGVVGGAAYMTPSTVATEAALSVLPETWSVGLVGMNQNCPPDLRTDEPNLETDHERLVKRFGRRVIATDRFAVAVSSPLRRRIAAIAGELGLRTQTHLNEQVGEKTLVEMDLYLGVGKYAEVYQKDGLLDHHCILAHCIYMLSDEWSIVRDSGSVIAHCPTSNLLLGSGVMSLDDVVERGIPYALATDVGASPTVSMLAEMGRFLEVHDGRSARATPSEALYRATLAPAEILGLDSSLGRLVAGRPASFIEVRPATGDIMTALADVRWADEVIERLIPADMNSPTLAVSRVTLDGRIVFEGRPVHA